LGGNVFVRQQGSITPIETPFVAQQAFPVIEYMDLIKQGRTGVGRQTMGLDPDALQNQTAEAVRDGRAASETQVEFYARNLAEMGLQRLFSCILKLVIKHQDRPKTIRLRDKWVDMDPRPWNAEMDCTINVGLGAGSRDRDMVMLQQIAGKQEMILQLLGPDNPLCDIALYRNTLAQMIDVGGLKSAEKYFKEVTPEAIQQMMQAQAQQPDPKMLELQAKMQMEAQKLQMTSQIETQRLQQQAEIEKTQAQADIVTQQQKTQSEIALAEHRFSLERELKLLDAQIRMREHSANVAAQGMKMRQKEDGSEEVVSSEDVRSEQTNAMFSQLAQALDNLARAHAAPKRLVRGPDGRPSHVETVVN
jgi:hypothetical protein